MLWARLENDQRAGGQSEQTAQQDIVEEELHQLIVCLKWMVSLSERNVYQDRLVKFFGILASMATTRARIQCVEVLVNFLVEWSQVCCLQCVAICSPLGSPARLSVSPTHRDPLDAQAKEHLARWRICQLIANLVNNMPEEATEDVGSSTLDQIECAMMRLLLQDAKPHVRSAAARALLRFPQMDEETDDFDSCKVVSALVTTLNTDKSKEVRKAVLSVLPMCGFTLPYVIARTRDESDEVRRVALLLLAEKTTMESCSCLNVSGREMSELLSKALRDRVPAVVEAGQELVTSWFDSCGGEPLTLLKALGVEGSEQTSASELALNALFASERLNAVHVAMLASNEQLGLRTDFRCEDPNLMTPEEALFWRVVCVHLSSEASQHGLMAANAIGATATVEAASAGERLEAFEAVMPSCLEEFAFIIGLHRGQLRTCTQLLMLVAQCADFADASGRKSIGDVVNAILVGEQAAAGDGTGAGEDVTAAEEASAAEELYEACFDVVRKVYSSEDSLHEASGLTIHAMLGRAGLLPLDPHKVHALTRRDQVALLRVVAGFLSVIKRMDMFEAIGLVGTAAIGETAEGNHVAEGEDRSSSGPSVFSWQDVFSYLIHPCTTSKDSCVRALSYKCMGLFGLVERDVSSCSMILRDMMNQLVTVDEDNEVKARIIQGLGDACLLRGPQAVEMLLRPSGVWGGDVSGDADDDGTPLPSIVDVLTHYAQEWMDETADEAFRPCGEAVIESLVKIAAVNEFRRQADEVQGRATALEDADMIRIIVKLFILSFHPCTSDSPKTRQGLLVFFQRYATMSVASQQYLATALLPSARTAAALDGAMRRKTVASGAIAPQVIKFAIQLLQMHVLDRDGNRELFGHEPLAEIVMGEIIACGSNPLVSKVYLNAICKVPAALPTYDAGTETSETVARIHAYALHAASMFSSEENSNSVCLKEVESIKKTYRWPGDAEDLPTAEQIEAMVVDLLSNLEEFCAGFPQPFGGDVGSDVCSSDEEGFEAHAAEATTGHRRLPPRRARAKVANMGESSDDDENVVKKLELTDAAPADSMAAADGASDDDDNNSDGDDGYEDDVENSAVNSPLPTPKSAGARDRRRQSLASVAALGEALSNQARLSS
ncbi:MAG: hypothetical protein ABGY24_17955 [bacterium]